MVHELWPRCFLPGNQPPSCSLCLPLRRRLPAAWFLLHGSVSRDAIGADLGATVYALDSTTIDLCLSLFPWARFRRTKAAVKLHTLLDLRGSLLTFLRISTGREHDVNILDEIVPEAGSFYIMDRGYIDFARLYAFVLGSAFYVVRCKKNMQLDRRYSRPVPLESGLLPDHTVVLRNYESARVYPEALWRVRFHDTEADQRLVFLTISTWRR